MNHHDLITVAQVSILIKRKISTVRIYVNKSLLPTHTVRTDELILQRKFMRYKKYLWSKEEVLLRLPKIHEYQRKSGRLKGYDLANALF